MSAESFNHPESEWGNLFAMQLSKIGMDYTELESRLDQDPTIDVFAMAFPTDRPKWDVGHYVMTHGVEVPVIHSLDDWRRAMLGGVAMLRSDAVSEYSGMSGVFSSHVIRRIGIYPKDENGNEDAGDWRLDGDTEEGNTAYRYKRLYEGPIALEPGFNDEHPWLDDNERGELRRKNARYIAGLLDGTIDPSTVMAQKFWTNDYESHKDNLNHYGILRPDFNMSNIHASMWRYIPGVNIRVFRDPVVEGKYYLGGRDAHHHWEITDGADSPDVEGHSKAYYRGRVESEDPEYTLPTRQIVELYEKVRNLPLFDNAQVPVMEMQLGNDGTLYFLQYLKTGQVIEDCGEFELPTKPGIVTCHNVRGSTGQAGESMRIYIDPRKFTPAMEGAGVLIDFDLRFDAAQYAAMNSKLAVVEMPLSFKDNHVTSAPLFRPPLAIGLWDGVGDAWEKFEPLKEQRPFRNAWSVVQEAEYIEATVTSNGRQATIDSDWTLRTQYL